MSAAVLALALASCQNEEVVSQADGMVSVKAVMGINSRTTVSEGGDVTWSKGDKMLVYGGETEGVLTLKGNGGSKDGIFTGFVQGSVSELTTALYPAEMASSDGTITLSQVTYPNSNSPMVAEWSTGTMQFSHLAGMLRISVTGLPNKTNTLKVSGTGIAGTATLNNGKLTDFSTGNETIVVKGIPTGDQVIDVPVFATETLKEVTLKVSVNNGTEKEIKAAIGIGAMQCVYLTLGANGDLAETDTYTGWYDENKTEFTLRTAEELKGLAALVNGNNNFAGKTITLNNDIDLEGLEWTPIGYNAGFCGNFDGDNHTIANLNCKISNGQGIGFIGKLNNKGIVENLILENAEIAGKKYVAGIVGWSPWGSDVTIRNCKVIGGNFINIPTTANSDNGKSVGAIVGMLSDGEVTNCLVENVSIVAYADLAGIVGKEQGNSKINNNTIRNSAVIQCNAVLGNEPGDVAKEILGEGDADIRNNKIENVAIINGVTLYSEQYPNIWTDAANSYCVYNAEGLDELKEALVQNSADVFRTIKLYADVDLKNEAWKPFDKMFATFDGQGHTIKNLNVTGKNDWAGRSGFFSYLGGSSIKNLTLENVTSSGCQAGIFAGHSEGGKIENCKIAGENIISWTGATADENVGSGIGIFAGVTIESSSIYTGEILNNASVTLVKNSLTEINGRITGVDWYAGGLYNASTPTINVLNNGNVSKR